MLACVRISIRCATEIWNQREFPDVCHEIVWHRRAGCGVAQNVDEFAQNKID
jgi:hypothetical protein